jgi:hypothetical protein
MSSSAGAGGKGGDDASGILACSFNQDQSWHGNSRTFSRNFHAPLEGCTKLSFTFCF